MKKIFLYKFLSIIFAVLAFGCTTPYNYQTQEFEDLLVVEATITNQLKFQEIKISRTYTLEESTPKVETGAAVYITDNLGDRYDFQEKNGTYVSLNQFQASSGRAYQLHVLTKDGKTYISTAEKLPQQTQIDHLEATAITKNDELGVEITVNSSDPTNMSKYYRYEYEETYQVIASKWYAKKAVVVNGKIQLVDRVEEARTCYSYQTSNELLLTNTSKLSEDKVVNFPVRFIDSKNKIIRNRYSILVKQYVQNLAAQTFYETLKQISNSGNILSQTQPGFFSGNLKSVDNPGEKIIGFFNVSTYSEKRIFFNFRDLFPKEFTPEYQYDCPYPIPEASVDQYVFSFSSNVAVELLKSGTRVYYPTETPDFILYDIQCGDCTSFSSNIKPSFWID
ncbi:DUF4249 domain-containing protein [Flavobacterium reichenbachii]|uniref:DUF4249 domain-containing protein n=1 Tax=Flavobacterium reichenbachii TaxID=362418 RepID=A0A085ZRH8_9FLAO|nr:DUF4249 domain-containing protein [Flavobacterium reichenbachii]KFF07042.1 hypothetical protein IW19_16645 [Flavobacterium reichenbachii]OXB11988.1 hypothetical protein B0A68_19865 [Flavobacterium reichenbachii]